MNETYNDESGKKGSTDKSIHLDQALLFGTVGTFDGRSKNDNQNNRQENLSPETINI